MAQGFASTSADCIYERSCARYILQREGSSDSEGLFAEYYRGNLKSLEKYVLCRTLAYQKDSLEHFNERPCLVGECHWQEDFGAYVANGMHCKGLHVAVGDFVVTKTKEVVVVRVCGLGGGNIFILGDVCEMTHDRETSMEVARTESLRLIWIADITDV